MATQEIEYLKEKLSEWENAAYAYFSFDEESEIDLISSAMEKYYQAAIRVCHAAKGIIK